MMRGTYHLQPLLHGSNAGQVLGGGLDVLLGGLLGQVNHVTGVERLAVDLEIVLVGIEQTVQPGEELLGAVVGVQDDGNAVGRGDATDVVGGRNTTGNGGVLAVVADALTGEVGGTTVGDLEDDGAFLVAGGLEARDDDGGGGDVLILSCMFQLQMGRSGDQGM